MILNITRTKTSIDKNKREKSLIFGEKREGDRERGTERDRRRGREGERQRGRIKVHA